MALPLHNLENLGNTCWCASAIQALRGVRVFSELFPRTTLLGRVLNDDKVPAALVAGFYSWARTLLTATYDGSPEDPAEFLVRLFDQKDVHEKLFASMRHKITCCERCHHVRASKSEECLFIIPYIPKCAKPLEKALYADFGYKIGYTSAEGLVDSYRDAVSPKGERWWRCDDNIVTEVALTVATPYLLFYVERGASWSVDDEGVDEEEEILSYEQIKNTLEHIDKKNNLELDCEGDCKRKTPHSVFVNNYETGSAVIMHVSMPRRMNLGCVERTLFQDKTGQPFELSAIICRVGGSHYVCYRKMM